MSTVRFIGLDVHAETMAVAVAEPTGEVRSLGVIPNRSESIRRLVKKLGPVGRLAPGKSVFHTETWELFDSLEQPFIPSALRERLANS